MRLIINAEMMQSYWLHQKAYISISKKIIFLQNHCRSLAKKPAPPNRNISKAELKRNLAIKELKI